jgi:hypothetical protein
MKRTFTTAIIEASDEFAYCGTKTGDVLEINIARAIFKVLFIKYMIIESWTLQ